MSINRANRRPVIRFLLMLAVWASAALLLAAQAYISSAIRGTPLTWSRPLAIWLGWAGAWVLLTPLVLQLAARYPLRRPKLRGALLIHGAASMVMAALSLALFAAIAPWVDATNVAPTWFATFSRLLGNAFVLSLPIYWLIVATTEAARLLRVAHERERRALRLETQVVEARLLALRAQLEPHFLFNALNTVAVLMREDVDVAERVLVKLSGLLRRALESSTAHETDLCNEIAFLEAYLEIEQTRFGERMTYAIAIDEEVRNARLPSLILQPLVENAIRHGLAARAAPGRIEINAARRGDRLQLSVRDDGPGLREGATSGIGLSNTRSRLDLIYGDDHDFELYSPDGGGVIAALLIPLRSG